MKNPQEERYSSHNRDITKRQPKKPAAELLSPAGDAVGVRAAIAAGADAVYLGAGSFSARAYAKNLDPEELIRALDFAHLHNRRIYLACNILMRKKELEAVPAMLDPLYEHGLDGVIVQDTGLLSLLHRRFPNLPLHASTQMAVLSEAGVEVLKRLGVSRVVPGRELSLEEIRTLRATGMEVECFIHGAMCYSYSGRCLMSSAAGGRSGNRGRCAGTCRQPYHFEGGEEQYLLSMKDMCALPALEELLDAGVDSLKIEGRMKAPEYTAGVTAVYRKALDHYYDSRVKGPDQEDLHTLEVLYIRDKKQEGYLHKHNGKEMISVTSPAYIEVPETLKEKIRREYLDKEMTLPVRMEAYIHAGEPVVLTAQTFGAEHFARAGAAEVQRAMKRGLSEEDIIKQLKKAGGTGFEVKDCRVDTDGEAFMPVKELNALRRELLEELKNDILSTHRRSPSDLVEQWVTEADMGNTREERFTGAALLAGVKTTSQARAVLREEAVEGIIADDTLFMEEENGAALIQRAHVSGKKIYLRLPEILRQKHLHQTEETLLRVLKEGADGVYCSSQDALGLAMRHCRREQIHAEGSVYAYNPPAIAGVLQWADTYSLSLEWNGKELSHAPFPARAEKQVYGYLPLMYSANCVLKTVKGCDKTAGVYHISDNKGHVFPIVPMHQLCYNIFYNCLPLSLHTQFPEFLARGAFGAYRLEFTMESEEETEAIARAYGALYRGKEADFSGILPEYTNGHEKRGAE